MLNTKMPIDLQAKHRHIMECVVKYMEVGETWNVEMNLPQYQGSKKKT